jgi:flagellar hook assembly protein FlgD
MARTARRPKGPTSRALVLLTSLAVASSWSVATSAFAVGEPTTTPTITAPTSGAQVAGNVAITASSTAPSVQFSLDATPIGSPVTVASGTASTSWATWGLANGSSHTWTAADCNGSGCNATQSTGVTVTVNNATPVLTAPTNGAIADRTITLTATAPGGGIRFSVDGSVVGFDGTAPYAFVVAGPLGEGTHTAAAQACDATGSTCAGPSTSASFTVQALHPKVSSVSPNPFSPNNDGRRDTATFRISLQGYQNVQYEIQNANGQTVEGPHFRGVLSPGTRTFHWTGKNNARRAVVNGTYFVVVTTSAKRGGATLHGLAKASVRVDRVGPRFSAAVGNGATIYPARDGYLDDFHPRVTVNEGGGLWLEIYSASGAKVREIARSHGGKGTFTFTWSGRDARGVAVPSGTYRYFFKAQDGAGNQTVGRSNHVRLRPERLVNKAVTRQLNGDQGTIQSSDWSCTSYSYSLSGFTHGVWFDNVCDPYYGFEAISANFTFSVPGAVRYNRLNVQSYGTPSLHAPEPIPVIVYNYAKGDWDGVGAVNICCNDVPHWTNYGTVSAQGKVGGGHVTVGFGVPNAVYLEDYDLGAMAITISYSVLQ